LGPASTTFSDPTGADSPFHVQTHSPSTSAA
jgi:hypothetical protein